MPRFPRLAGIATAAVALAALAAAPTSAKEPTLTDPRVVEHFDFAAGQTPESIALEPDGSANVTFALARQVARLSPHHEPRVIAELPAVAGQNTPITETAVATGLVRAHDGTLYVNYATGTKLTGIWRISPKSHHVKQIACLPKNGFPNGLALDEHHGVLYSADSVRGTVWRVPAKGAQGHDCLKPKAWATGSKLERSAPPTGFVGANGLKVRHSAVWVTNSDKGLLLRIPVKKNGSAGKIQTRATGLTNVDDFAFTGRDDTILAALFTDNKVALVRPNGTHRVVLTAKDGLSNPSAVAVQGKTVYVTSPAFFTMQDPNLLLATLNKHHS
ncbi:hypothetical protein BGM19_15280 [Streptomyces agglomeratus]|uniref:hypothetical protein n=1 Tax=Streptomyces agglomeratus TaxID=285458 RepID=UPI00086E8E77|nr:hypothetical protein [Streptomyces agglomeratus]OEJ59145.1 hypothetical protein BGM19_15280 [Streptomyces agglomeratus]